MAHTYAAQDISHLTGAAVAFGQIVKFSGVDAQNAGLAVPCATAGEQAVGVAASVATAAGETLMITVGGVCKALFGATVAPVYVSPLMLQVVLLRLVRVRLYWVLLYWVPVTVRSVLFCSIKMAQCLLPNKGITK